MLLLKLESYSNLFLISLAVSFSLSFFLWLFRLHLHKISSLPSSSFFSTTSSPPSPPSPPLPLLLVTAHPDDESMFFIPTLEALRHSGACSETHILCCSTGNSEGRGSVRAGELVNATRLLGIREQNVAVLDHYALRDGMREKWDSSAVAAAIRASVRKILESQGVTRKDHSSSLGICIVSFDERGVSGHPNHCAVYKGVEEFLQGSVELGQNISSNQVFCYKLETVSMWRKFSSIFDIGLSFLIHTIRMAFFLLVQGSCLRFNTSSQDSSSKGWPEHLFLVGGGIKRAHSAMMEHKSQFNWWRQLFIIFSRYSFVNTLQRVRIVETNKSL